jgi:transcriptional regulator with XRE-family HTH domain
MEPAKEALKAMREARGWTLAELARRAACDAAYLGRVERGERTPSPYFVSHLARVLAEEEAVA